MTELEIYKAARALIADKQNWTTKTYAKDASNYCVDVYHPSACRFCSMGACYKVQGPGHDQPLTTLYDASKERLGYLSVVDVNDGLGHAETLKMFDRAIELCTKKEEK